MVFDAGTFTAQNNLARVGLKADGTNTAGASSVCGILDSGTTAGRNFYHNSVYLGGTQTSGTGRTGAFQSVGAGNARTFQNNIFVNARSTSGGSFKHYAVIYYAGNNTGLKAGGNIFLASGTGGHLAQYNNSLDRDTLLAWQTSTGQDATSGVTDPLFVNPTGDAGSVAATAVDLHLQSSNPAEGQGILIASVTNDFDGETRSGLTPVDIGADAGGFSLSSDVFAPVVSYPTLPQGSTANRTLTGFATIVDSVAVAGGANSPRLYFKRSTDADIFGGNTAADNGWKYVAADNSASPYGFTIDYSIINGGSVAPGDTVQYFVVAQDAANNLGSNPVGAGSSGNPPVQNLSAHGAVSSYAIGAGLSGTKTVCASGCDYANLTDASGAFAAINGAVVTGNLIINISGDLTENGTNGLNQLVTNDFPAAAYTVTIQPDAAAMRTISGSVANAMIRLNGADRVTIDGRFSNAGRFLTFRNTNTGYPTITLLNDASNNTIRSSVIEGASSVVVFFSTGTATGNDNNLVTDNRIRDRSDATGVAQILIYAAGTSAIVANGNNSITANEIFNFTLSGVWIEATGNENWTITGNTIYQTDARTSSITGIQFGAAGTNTISGNTVRDLTSTTFTSGIVVQQTYGNLTVARNRIYNFTSAAGNVARFIGVSFNGTDVGQSITLVNNQITIIPSFTNAQNLYGIWDRATAAGPAVVAYNSVVVGGTGSGTNGSWAFSRTGASACSLRNNIFLNVRTGGGSHYAGGSASTSGSVSTDYNVFAGTGTTAANFMDSSNGQGPTGTPISFAQWQASFGGDTHSSGANPGGNFTTSMFVNPAAGDLHIIATGNPLVMNTGTPVVGIDKDYDNDTRHATTPDIGADEFAGALVVSSNQVIPAGNYDNIAVDPGVTATLGGIVNVSGTLTLGCTAQLSGGSPANYVTGSLKKNFCSGGSFMFPVGTAAGYAPVTVNATAGTFPGDFTVKANDGTLAGTVAAQSLTRNWTLTRNNISQADITFTYNDADVPAGADESTFKFVRRSGNVDIAFGPSNFDVTTNTFTLLGVSGFSDWALGKVAAPTAALVEVSGRILTANGRGITNVRVALTDQNGFTRYTNSGSFGYYHFTDIEAGQIYILNVGAKRFIFTEPTRMIFVNEAMNGQDFVADP
jgi:hypothetical protein